MGQLNPLIGFLSLAGRILNGDRGSSVEPASREYAEFLITLSVPEL